jgi:hypothetical protein
MHAVHVYFMGEEDTQPITDLVAWILFARRHKQISAAKTIFLNYPA